MNTYGKLDAAFGILNSKGIVARHNFMDCQSCGYAAMEDEIEKNSIPVRGCTFYHEQDTERAANDGMLFLSHSGVDKASDSIANEIIRAIKEQQLHVEWDGSRDSRIQVFVNADDFAFMVSDETAEDEDWERMQDEDDEIYID